MVKRKLINFVAIIIFIYCLYSINQKASQVSQSNEEYLYIMERIGKGKSINDNLLDRIKQIARQQISQKNQQSPFCFIKAFAKIVIQNPTNTKHMFTILKDQYPQFQKITNCSQYLSLLIYRAEQLEKNQKQRVLQQLYKLQTDALSQKYPKKSEESPIYMYFHSYNVEKTVKDQLKTLVHQQYSNKKVKIEDDASKDNSPIFIQYSLQNEQSSKVNFVPNLQRKGILKGVQEFLITIDQDNSIVVLLQGSQYLLGSHALWIMQKIFVNEQADLIFFGAFSHQHHNIQNVQSISQLESAVNPFFAFRKSLASGINFEEKRFDEIERNYLAHALVEQAKKKEKKVLIVDQAIIHRPSSHNLTLLSKIEHQISQKFQA